MSDTTWPSGTYLGYLGDDGSEAKLQEWEVWRGRAAGSRLDFAVSRSVTDWATFANPAQWLSLASALPRNRRDSLVVNIPGLISDGTSNIVDGASGAYNAWWLELFERMATAGLTAAAMRYLHEPNGSWYRWSVGANVDGGNPDAGAADGGASALRAYFLEIAGQATAAGLLGNLHLSPVLTVNSSTKVLWDTLVPLGSAYHSRLVIGGDLYDQSWKAGSYPILSTDDAATVQAKRDVAWGEYLNGQRGLAYLATFCRNNGLKARLDEWGLSVRPQDYPGDATRPYGNGGGDNVSFITRVHAWLVSVADVLEGEAYFDRDASDGKHKMGPGHQGYFPNATQEYLRLFGPDTSTGDGIVRLSDAAALYVGGDPVLRVMVGDTQAWPVV